MPRQRERRFRSKAEIESSLKDCSRSRRGQRVFGKNMGCSAQRIVRPDYAGRTMPYQSTCLAFPVD